ncbi:hypothetical protein GCM10025859_40430 [Alicyclobacillus fastidiosus]|nr:hypothetical protein GCM10025859_40430 [Alicyclobacillus fastidiosus]
MDKRVTIQDVARHAGVSITTVSRFLNERYDSMSEATRGRIEAVIRDLGYRPNALAQGLKGNRTKIVAAVVVNMSYPFCVGFMRSLNQTLSPAGYHLFVSETAGNPDRERAVVQSLQAQRVDAMVLQTGGQNNDLLAAIATQMPVIFVDRKYSVPGVTNVITNNREASEQLTAHILEQGYRRVLYVTEEEDGVHTRKERLQGYLQACHKRSIKPWVITVDRDQKDTFDVVVNAVEDGAKRTHRRLYGQWAPHDALVSRACPTRLSSPKPVGARHFRSARLVWLSPAFVDVRRATRRYDGGTDRRDAAPEARQTGRDSVF